MDEEAAFHENTKAEDKASNSSDVEMLNNI